VWSGASALSLSKLHYSYTKNFYRVEKTHFLKDAHRWNITMYLKSYIKNTGKIKTYEILSLYKEQLNLGCSLQIVMSMITVSLRAIGYRYFKKLKKPGKDELI